MAKALIIVDMVKGFVDESTKKGPCALYIKGARSIIENINREIASLSNGDRVIYVCDNHAPGDAEFKRWPKHCVIGSEESEIASGLTVGQFGVTMKGISYFLVRKTRFSGFFNTYLDEMLIGVKDVVIVGVATEYCVFATALDASYRDLNVTIPMDCVFAIDQSVGDTSLNWLVASLGVTVR